MNTSATSTHRALAPIAEMWAAFLEEEAILEESGSETGPLGNVVDFNPSASTSDRPAIHGERSA